MKKSFISIFTALIISFTLLLQVNAYNVRSKNLPCSECELVQCTKCFDNCSQCPSCQSECTTTPEFTDVDDDDELPDDHTTKQEGSAPQIVTVQGTYVGQMDSNSIEVTVADKPMALYFSEIVKAKFAEKGLKKGDPVKIQYYRNIRGQNILTSIELTR
jgi:hypothetical protein